jgi:phosphatidylglycerophosphate synthase
MQAVLFKTSGQEWWWLGGMSLLERNLRLLASAGCETVLVLHPADNPLPLLVVPRPLGITVEAAEVTVSTANPLTILHSLEFPDHDPLFFFDANLLLDSRVLDALKQRTPPCFLVSANGSPHHLVWRVGWLTQETIAAGNAAVQHADRLLLTSVEPYDTELYSEGPPYCVKITGKDDLPRGWKLLIDRASRRPADVVEKYVDPPIENWLVHKLCDTAVTPNLVTLLAIAVALTAGSLFYQGWFLPAVLFAWTATVLDGVDGKLARVKLMTTSTGKLGRIAGFCYESAWYLAWAAYLTRTYDPVAWEVGTAFAICNGCDQVLITAFAQFRGKPLGEMSRFDQRFNLIGGQRRIYLAMLLVGFLVGMPLQALQAVLWWAVVTVFIHLGQVLYHVARHALGH